MPKIMLEIKSGTKPQYGIDTEAVAEAARMLGIQKQILLVFKKMRNRDGEHGFVERFNSHVVRVRPDLSQTRGSWVIWHELTHAMQEERHENFNEKYWKANKTYGYLNNPYEVEANEIAAAYWAKFLTNNRPKTETDLLFDRLNEEE